MASGNIGRTGINVFTINLIGKEIEVVFLHKVTDLLHLTTRIKITRRVVGIANHDGARAVVDEFFKFLHLRQGETFLDRCGDGANLGTGRNGKRHIVGISWFGYDNLVARIEARHECKQNSFGTARGDDDVVCRYVDVVFGIIAHQFLAITEVTLRW